MIKIELNRLDNDFNMEAINELGNKVVMDGSPADGGHNSGFRPMQMLLAAAGGGGAPLLLAYPPSELTQVLVPVVCSSRVHLPGSLRSPGVTRLHRYYGPSDSDAGQHPAPVSPLGPCSLPIVPTPTTSTPTCLQFWQSLDRDRLAAGAAGFALRSQARPLCLPYRVHLRLGPTFRLRLLSTPPSGDAVAFDCTPVFASGAVMTFSS